MSISKEKVLAALDKPRALYSVHSLIDPGTKSTDNTQDLLKAMREEGLVRFDINTGRCSKA